MYNGLLRFNKHILNELAEGLKHLPNLDGVSKGDSLIINEQGNTNLTSEGFKQGGLGAGVTNLVLDKWTAKKADYNSKRGSDGQDTDKAVCVLLLGGRADHGSDTGSDSFYSSWVRSGSGAYVGFFTTVKLD